MLREIGRKESIVYEHVFQTTVTSQLKRLHTCDVPDLQSFYKPWLSPHETLLYIYIYICTVRMYNVLYCVQVTEQTDWSGHMRVWT
jgi:hypothetical protein